MMDRSLHPHILFKPQCLLRGVLLALAGLVAMSLPAAVRLPKQFSDGMVLQRGKPAPVWGWAAPGEEVTVRFAGQRATAVADADGAWSVRLKPPAMSRQPRELTVTGANTVVVHNVVVGDVWLCSGDFGVYWELYSCLDAEQEIAGANYPLIRLLKVEGKSSNTPLKELQPEWIRGEWKVCSPETVADYSALAYFFGRALHRETGVPIGLIDASYRYSTIQSWVSAWGFHAVPELELPRNRIDSWDSTTDAGREAYRATLDRVEAWLPAAEQAFRDGKPIPAQPTPPAPKPAIDVNYWSLGELSNLYNGMIAPLMPFAIRGMVWSMGENGGGIEWNKYDSYMRGLVEGWRNRWGQGDFPVYFELLPQIGKTGGAPGAGGQWAAFREMQIRCLAIPNTGMVTTFDVSDYIAEARNRRDAGERFACLALAREYGHKLEYSGPVYREHRIDGNRVIISFDHVGHGLLAGEKDGLTPLLPAKDGSLKGFAIAGEDEKWYWADARIVGQTVVLQSEQAPAPVAVRYAWADNPAGSNLYNREGLPAVPFRTDDW